MRRSVLFAAAVVAAQSLVVCTAQADDEGYYARFLVGAGSLGDSSVSGSEGTAGDLSFDSGFLGGGAFGYDFGNWRLEGELIYRTNDADTFTGSLELPGALGDFSSLSFGVDALYEFDLFGSPRVTSYVGAGLAFIQEVDIDQTASASVPPPP